MTNNRVVTKKRLKRSNFSEKHVHLSWIIPLLLALGILFVASILIKKFSTPFCANSISCISDLGGQYKDGLSTGEFLGKSIQAPSLVAYSPNTTVLGTEDNSKKRLEVDLTNQRLYAFEDNTVIFSFPVSTGKWGPTPTGDFRIWIKLRYTLMKGGSRLAGDYYYLPNVPYTMYFYNDKTPKSMGYGIHGAYWHNNFGHPMSHGCVNMAIGDVEKIYNWAKPDSTGTRTLASADNPGTLIKIYGSPPAN
jgi:hypothetical protein